MLKAAESFFEWAVKRAAVMIAHAACDQHDREVRRGIRVQDESLERVARAEVRGNSQRLH